MRSVSIKKSADYVMAKLVEKGVVIQRYEAYSTNSIYFKFDCGLSNSIRFGDHKGKKNLNYMFLVDVNYGGGVNKMKRNFTQYRYSAKQSELDKLIMHILEHREKRIIQYGGSALYREQMKRQYLKNKDQKGFWSQAVFISKKTEKEVAK